MDLWFRGRAQPVLIPKQIQKIYLSFYPVFIPKAQNVASNIMIFMFSSHTEQLSVCLHFVAHFTLMLLREGFLSFKNIL